VRWYKVQETTPKKDLARPPQPAKQYATKPGKDHRTLVDVLPNGLEGWVSGIGFSNWTKGDSRWSLT
jgi:hypothetical protein